MLSARLPQRAGAPQCKIDEENESKSTDFEITFIADKKLHEHRISLVLTTGIITKEELVHVVENRHTSLFHKESTKSPYVFHHNS